MQPRPRRDRLTADARRASLLDAARDLIVESGPGEVSVGTVAQRAGVTRALVYKHFADREDVIVALYRRETATIDREVRRRVQDAPPGFEPRLRALVAAAFDLVGDHAPLVSSLRDVRADPGARSDRRGWDARAVAYFSDLAVAEFGLTPDVARTAVTALLSGIPSVVALLAADPTDARRRELEATYVTAVVGALATLQVSRTASPL